MKEKIQDLWFYYKWYLIAGAAVLLILLNFWSQKRQSPEPDYYFSIVTGTDIPQADRDAVALRLESVLDDRNGDGKVIVTVNLYQYNGRPDQAEDTAAFMAAAVQLTADLQEKISVCYAADCEALLNEDGFLLDLGSVEDSVLSGETRLQGFCLLCFPENADTAGRILKYKEKE